MHRSANKKPRYARLFVYRPDLRFALLDRKAVFVGVDRDGRAFLEVAAEEEAAEGGLNVALDVALQGPGAVGRIEAVLGDEGLGLIGEDELDAVVFAALGEVLDEELHDLFDFRFLEGLEKDDLIDAVQELRPEVGIQ